MFKSYNDITNTINDIAVHTPISPTFIKYDSNNHPVYEIILSTSCDYEVSFRQRFGININLYGHLFLTRYWNVSDQDIADGKPHMNCFFKWIVEDTSYTASAFIFKFYPVGWAEEGRPYINDIKLQITHLVGNNQQILSSYSMLFYRCNMS